MKFWFAACLFLGFLNVRSLLLCFVLVFLLIFACAAVLLFSGPKLEDLLFFSGLYAGRAVLTALLRVIRRLLLLFLYFRRASEGPF